MKKTGSGLKTLRNWRLSLQTPLSSNASLGVFPFLSSNLSKLNPTPQFDRFFKREENEEKVENKEREINSSSMSARDNIRQLYTNEGGVVVGGSSHNSLVSWYDVM